MRDGFVGNPVAQRAVRLVSEGVGSAPLTCPVPAALALVTAKSGGQGLLETTAMQLLLHGNAFVQVLPDATGSPRELFALRPDRVTIETDQRGWPAAYLYRAGDSVTRLAAEDAQGRAAVIHVKMVHPLDDHYGLGCFGAAAGAIAIHNAATRWNKALLDNAARPSGALVYEPGELGDYGNRIPSLSFEVIADEAGVGVGTMIAALAPGVSAPAGPVLDGFTVTGGSVRAVIDTLSPAFPMSCRGGAAAQIQFTTPPAVVLDEADLGARTGEGTPGKREIDVAPVDTVAGAVTVAYLDAARDYQAGLQRARREGPGRREERIDLPATIAAGAAFRIAQGALATRLGERVGGRAALPWRALALRPGDSVAVAGAQWRIGEVRFEAMCIALRLVRQAAAVPAAAIVAPGRPTAQVDAVQGRTTLAVVDLPPLSDVPAARAAVAVFACGTSGGWRRADLLASIDGGITFVPAGTTALPAAIGTLATELATGSPWVVDRINSVEVTLLDPGERLVDADNDALLAGANAALVGDELVQFGRALEVGPGRWRLSELWRGRRGTEDAIVVHGPGTRFVLIDEATAFVLPQTLAVAGVQVMAAGVGDVVPYPLATCPTAARATAPLAPVRLAAERNATGDTVLTWTRRSRDGWQWRDGVEVPIAEASERYRVTRIAGTSVIAEETTSPSFGYSNTQRSVDAAAGITSVGFEIRQIGATALSPAALLTLQIA